MRIGWSIAALVGLLLPVRAIAEPQPSHGPYVSIGGGALQTQTFSYDSVDTTFHPGSSLEVAAGYNFGDFRADLSYVYGSSAAETISLQLFDSTQNPATTGSIQTNSLFLNGYYYVPIKHKIRPYVGGGVGYTRLGVSMGASGYGIAYEFVGSGNTLGYQAKLGVAYRSTNQLEFFAEGIYRGLTMGISPYASLDSFGAQAGLKFHF